MLPTFIRRRSSSAALIIQTDHHRFINGAGCAKLNVARRILNLRLDT
jgi:hypothetical protein